jgi:amino acid transporter
MEEKRPHQHLLRKNALSTYDAVAQSIALLSLVLGVATTTSLAAGPAGAAAPLAYLLAGLGCLCLAYVFIRFAGRLPSAGGIYTYIVHGLGPIVGFLGGWLYTGAFIGVAIFLTIAVIALSALLANIHIMVHWFLLYLVLLVLLFFCAFFDIRISTRLQLVLSVLGVLSVLILIVAILARGGASGLSLTPFSPAALPSGLSGLLFATIFGFTSFIGFEGAIVLGEETVNPRRAIPRAVLISVLVGMLFFVLASYSLSIGYGVTHASTWAQDQAPLDTLGNRYIGSVLTSVIDLMVVLGALMAALANFNLIARVLYAMGRDRGLPSVFARTHSQYQTPWVGLLCVAVITLVLGATLGLSMGPFPFFSFLLTVGSGAILLAYLLAALSGMVFFWREDRQERKVLVRVLDVLLPVIAILLCGATLFGTLSSAREFPLTLAPYISVGWLVLGMIVVGWLWISRRELVRAFGKLLADSGAE